MGLPLFIAPVQSDIPARVATKCPSRSGIRRSNRSDSVRERSTRAYNALHHNFYSQYAQLAYDGLLPRHESPMPLDAANSQPPSSAFLDGRGNQLLSDSSRARLEQERAEAFFANNRPQSTSLVPALPPAPPLFEDSESWSRSGEPLTSRARSSQTVSIWKLDNRVAPFVSSSDTKVPNQAASHVSRFYQIPDDARPGRGSPSRGYHARGSPSRALRSSRLDDAPLSTSATANPRRTSSSRSRARPMISTRTSRRSLTARPAAPGGVDGLGDRDRSPSLETWDTLFATMTPDPQQLSAGSSFASTEASQSADPSLATPLSPPDVVAPPPEVHCDSACEDYDDNPDEQGINHGGDHADAADAVTAVVRRRPDRNYPFWHIEMRRGTDGGTTSQSPARGARIAGTEAQSGGAPAQGDMSLARFLNDASRVAGEALSAQGVNDGGGAVQPPSHRGLRAVAARASSTRLAGEEGWSGMQRIVSSLARREDIPDEWWAEVGLSRTLPHEENATMD